MNLIDFITEFPDEESCKQKFKEHREAVGVVYVKCGNTKHYWKARRIGYLKMNVIEDLKKGTINQAVEDLAAKESSVVTDVSASYVELSNYVESRQSEVIPEEKVGEALTWVHVTISNAKRQLLNTFHSLKPEFLKSNLDEFCYKFNRRYFSEALFNRLFVTAVSYKQRCRGKINLSKNNELVL